MSEIKLPNEIVKASARKPKNLIIFSKPKVGKTEMLAQLPNSLLIDLEDGSDYVDALKVKAESIEDIHEIGRQIKAANYPYDYIIIDTITALEEKCIPYAEILYSKRILGKNWFKKNAQGKLDISSGKVQYGSILNLPNGAGYTYLREAMNRVIKYVKTLAPHMILAGHVKDVQLEKAGGEFTSSDIDLTGKIKRMLASQSDAIGYLYRKKTNQNVLSFITSDAVACGTRTPHLRNTEIVISEMKDGKLVTYWDKVYLD